MAVPTDTPCVRDIDGNANALSASSLYISDSCQVTVYFIVICD